MKQSRGFITFRQLEGPYCYPSLFRNSMCEKTLFRHCRRCRSPHQLLLATSQHCAGESASIFNVSHGDAFAFEPTFQGLQFWRSTDRDGLMQLAMSPRPEPGRCFLITEWNPQTGFIKVADALCVHDLMIRSLLPKFVAADKTPPLAFVKNLVKGPQ